VEEALEEGSGEEGGGASADEEGAGAWCAEEGAVEVDLAGEGVEESVGMFELTGDGVEVAIVALGGTKRDVEIDGVDEVSLVGEGCGKRELGGG